MKTRLTRLYTNNIIDHMNFYNSDTVYFAVSMGVGG